MVLPGPIALLLAAALAGGCGMETQYVPRTPHTLALAMKRGEMALYKDGALIELAAAPAAVRGCPPPVAADVGEAAGHHASYRRNAKLGGVFNALGVFAPPMIGVGIVFQVLATGHQQQSNAHLVDAVNRHNDAPECAR
jgi:hypothetical protein